MTACLHPSTTPPISRATTAQRTHEEAPARDERPDPRTRPPALDAFDAAPASPVRATGRRAPKGGTGRAAGVGLVALRAQGSTTPVAKWVSPLHLRLKNEQDTVVIPASNYLLGPRGAVRPEFAKIAEVILGRAPARQAELDARMTAAHSAREMSFQAKDHATGRYDKTFAVPVHAAVVPFKKSHFDLLVRSGGPVLRALRSMLQAIYSKKDFTAEDLGLEGLSAAEQARIVETIRGSVYFEPKLVDPALADYPFLAVAGFDAAVGDLDAPEPVFFEYNLGTPSGISNNVQLLETLREEDPELFAAFADRLPADDTFALLKRAIDSNAAAWTRRTDGISVVVGPGPYNGAHPDVASIGLFTGMPRVPLSSLYEDAKGDIRLNTGRFADDPVVTGIYGRMEESYFLQSNADGVPVRGPGIDNRALAAKTGLPLEDNVRYWTKLDDQGAEIGVHCDENGKPLFMPVWETMGRDPGRPDAPRGSFLAAVKGRKLYYSGLGGRVVDDKRVFQAVSSHVAPHSAPPGTPIAHPPRTLDPSEYERFYASEHLEQFVVKEPDNSGGVGVHLLVNLAPEARRAVIELVKADPHRYIVQEFARPAVMFSPETDEDGTLALGTLANDLRVFILMDAEGEVSGGPNSLLLRVAKKASASTNTSQGAGYGIMAVLEDAPTGRPIDSLLPRVEQPFVAAEQRALVERFIDQMNALTRLVHPRSNAPAQDAARGLASVHREVMDLLGREYSTLMTACRQFAAGEIDRAALRRALLETRIGLLEADQLPAPSIVGDVHRGLGQAHLEPTPSRDREQARAALEVVPFETPRKVEETTLFGAPVERVEVGRVETCADAEIQGAIDEFRAAGGEVRLHRLRRPGSSSFLPEYAVSDLRFEGTKPILDLDPAQDLLRAGVAHQRAILRWVLEQARTTGGRAEPPPSPANLERAVQRLDSPEGRLAATRVAVDAELAAEAETTPLWNEVSLPLARAATEPGYVARVTYPELLALRRALRDAPRGSDDRPALSLLRAMITRARDLLEEGTTALTTELRALERTRGREEEALMVRAKALALEKTSLFDHLFPSWNLQLFEADGTRATLERLFRAAR